MEGRCKEVFSHLKTPPDGIVARLDEEAKIHVATEMLGCNVLVYTDSYQCDVRFLPGIEILKPAWVCARRVL